MAREAALSALACWPFYRSERELCTAIHRQKLACGKPSRKAPNKGRARGLRRVPLTPNVTPNDGGVQEGSERRSRKDRGKRLLRGPTGRTGRAEFLEPRVDGATRLSDCLRDVIICHVLEPRQDSVTSLKQFPQKFGLFHDANLAAVRLLKTASFHQTLLVVAEGDEAA
jgi:hypothetical protein